MFYTSYISTDENIVTSIRNAKQTVPYGFSFRKDCSCCCNTFGGAHSWISLQHQSSAVVVRDEENLNRRLLHLHVLLFVPME